MKAKQKIEEIYNEGRKVFGNNYDPHLYYVPMRVNGIPCNALVGCSNDTSTIYYEWLQPVEVPCIEYVYLFDRKGYRAKWLERYIGDCISPEWEKFVMDFWKAVKESAPDYY